MTENADAARAATRARRLEEDIASLAAKIDRFPATFQEANEIGSEHESASRDSEQSIFEETVFRSRCSLRMKMWEKERQLAEINETARVARVVAEAEEANPEMKVRSDVLQCPICLEDECVSRPGGRFLTCCGTVLCTSCWNGSNGEALDQMSCCPYCRTTRPESDEDAHARLLPKAKRAQAQAWTKRAVAENFKSGNGCEKDEGEAVFWYHRAAESGDSIAQHTLGVLYRKGLMGVQQSDSKGHHFYSLSAANGHPVAFYNLGFMSAEKGNYTEAARWYTLSANQQHPDAQYKLGLYFDEGKGLKQSLETSLYYFEKAALNGHVKGQLMFSRSLLDAAEEMYDGRANLVAFSVVPRAYYFSRKAAEAGDIDAISDVEEMEKLFLTKCSNCNVDLTGGGEEARPKVTCARCEAAVFCDLYCMAEHWKAGHKEDCVNCKELDALLEANK